MVTNERVIVFYCCCVLYVGCSNKQMASLEKFLPKNFEALESHAYWCIRRFNTKDIKGRKLFFNKRRKKISQNIYFYFHLDPPPNK